MRVEGPMHKWTEAWKSEFKYLLSWLPDTLFRAVLRGLYWARLLGPHPRTFVRIGMPARVLQGPFKGMWYRPLNIGSHWLPKIAGTYELELSCALDALCKKPCDVLVNIGCGEGYYAVGLTLELRPNRTWCYDPHPDVPRFLRRLAQANGVAESITWRASCTPVELQAALEHALTPVVICDCEGCEDEVLRPDVATRLRQATVIVELHDSLRAGVSDRILERFAPSHRIEIIRSRGRQPSDLCWPAELSDADFENLTSEGRGPSMQWYVMWPKE